MPARIAFASQIKKDPHMDILRHADQPLEKWRDGVMTQMRMSFLVGGRQFCIFDQFCGPGLGAPMHIHAVEEVLEVVSGSAEVWLNDEKAHVGPDESVLIPAGTRHGFRNTGTDTLHVRATMAASIFEAEYDSTKETSRRWSPT